MGKANVYRSFFKTEREYLKIILSNIIGRFGDSIDSIAYGWMVYELTGSKSWLAVIYGVNSIPTILFQPFAGALVEFFDKKTAVILCDIGRGCVVLCTGIMLISGVLEPWHLLIFTFLISCFECFRIPSSLAIIPSVLQKENYNIGLSLNQTASRIFELIGLGCAGFIIGLLGCGGAIIIDAITFFLSASLFYILKVSKNSENTERKKISVKNYFNDLYGGILYFKENHAAFVICIIGFLLNITAVPLEKLQAAYVNECLRLGVNAMSVGSIFMTCGLLSGTIVFVYISKKFTTKQILIYGGALIGVLYFSLMYIGLISFIPMRYMAYAGILGIFGFINSLIGMSVQVAFMSSTPDGYIGRVGGIFNAIACSSIPVGSFLLAMIFPFLSIVQTYFYFGIATIFIFLLLGRLKSMKILDNSF